MPDNYIEMEIREIQVADDPRELPIIVLHEKHGNRQFPIFIGHYEGHTLDEAVIKTPGHVGNTKRPLTHDLILNITDGLNARFTRVLITKLENGTFYGAIEIQNSDQSTITIDSRPSDAMILAMKRQLPIYAEENVLAEAENDENDIQD